MKARSIVISLVMCFVALTWCFAQDAMMDGVDPTGKPTHSEWTGKFDGKEYPVTGDANSDTRSYKKIDDRTLEVSAKKGGKVMVSGRVVVSPDGKTRTAHVKGTSPSGEKFQTTAVYDKQ